MFDVSKDEELREAFCWRNTESLLKQDHRQKGTKFNFLDYQLQFIKAYQLIKLNEKGPNEDIHQWHLQPTSIEKLSNQKTSIQPQWWNLVYWFGWYDRLQNFKY